MAISNFVSSAWSAKTYLALQDQLVFGSPAVVNRNFEGEVRGDQILKINSVGAVTAHAYSGAVSFDALTDAQKVLTVNTKYYTAVAIDDVDASQVHGINLMNDATRNAGYAMAKVIELFLAALMQSEGTDALAKLTDGANPSVDAAVQNLVDLWRALTEADIPETDRWAIVPPWYYARLLQSTNFVSAATINGPSAVLANAKVGRLAGFDIYVSNNCPASGTKDNTMFAGHPMAMTFAHGVEKTEAVRIEGAFADGIKSLAVWGAKTIYPTGIQYAVVSED